MKIFNKYIKTIIQVLAIIIFFSTLHAKNPHKYETGESISNYFSGIILFNDNKFDDSYSRFKKLEGLELYYNNYSSKYLFSLINSGNFNEAFRYSKKIEKEKINNFESDLIIGIYYLKNDKFDLAREYFKKINSRNSQFLINNFLSESLLNWSNFKSINFKEAKNEIDKIDQRFSSLKKIQNTFLHCFYDSEKTEDFYKNLSSKDETNLSRYNYFYALYLSDKNKINQANQVVETALELYPRNLLLNQYILDKDTGKFQNYFNCKDTTHVIAEILYIVANALSSQNIYTYSNFYLNLSKYLNEDFYSFETLLAENFYKMNNFELAKKTYKHVGKNSKIYGWYSAKQNATILIDEKKNKQALKLLENSYKKLPNKSIFEKYDYARFLKNNDQFDKAIVLYSEIINKIDETHSLFPKAMDGRGVAYERIGEWDKAQKDLLSSLKASPDQAYVINYLAYSWIEKGVNVKKALKMLQKANNLKTNDPYIIDSLGWALFKLEKYVESKKYLQSAVKLMPADPIINDHYGDVLWKNGKKIEARYYWSYVLNLKDTEDDLKDIIKNKLLLGL